VAGTGTVSATADSGLAVGYTSLTPATCTVTGNTVTGIAPGTCTIAADQAGDAYYNAAPQATQSFEVQSTVPAAPVIGVAVAGNAQATISFTPPTNDGGAAITSYTVTSGPGGITATGTGSPIVVTGLVNGTTYTFTVTATNSVGTSLPSVTSNAVTPKADQTITFAAAPTLFVGGAGTVSATADSGLAVGYASLTPASCTITGNTVTGIAPGTCTIAADQAGDASHNAATQVTQSFAVKNQTFDFNLDGKSDILWRKSTRGENLRWFMGGTSIGR
jgi:hypothetical protein